MKKLTSVGVAIFFLTAVHSQAVRPSVVNASGGSHRAGYFQFDWSVGEMAIIGEMSNSSGSVTLTNGFIQAYTEHPQAGNGNNYFGPDEIRIFPNPASTYVEINFLTKEKGRITLQFYDVSGKKVFTGSLTSYGNGLIERIPVTYFPNAIYMLHIDMQAEAGFTSKKGIYKIIIAH